MMRRLGSQQRYSPSDYSDSHISSETQFGELKLSEFSPKMPSESSGSVDDGNRESSPSRDSGISDSELGSSIVEKSELGAQCAQLCKELKTVAYLSQDFLHDVVQEKENPRELLEELEAKIRPFLITLDQDLSAQERVLRKSLDRSTISDPRVSWLLEFNRYQLEFRKMFTRLSNDVCDDFEHVLRLRARGCQGLAPKKDTGRFLREMASSLEKTDKAIQLERCKRGVVTR